MEGHDQKNNLSGTLRRIGAPTFAPDRYVPPLSNSLRRHCVTAIIIEHTSADFYSSYIHKVFSYAFENGFPIKKFKMSNRKFHRKPLITPGLVTSCNIKHKLYKCFDNNP